MSWKRQVTYCQTRASDIFKLLKAQDFLFVFFAVGTFVMFSAYLFNRTDHTVPFSVNVDFTITVILGFLMLLLLGAFDLGLTKFFLVLE
jgi:hypothetical protein